MAALPPVGGRYEIKETLGSGGFAMVYRAHDPVLDRAIALKVLHPHLARNHSIRDRFVREGRVLARVRHPNMVQVHDAGETGETAYIAMELVEGPSLETVLERRGPLPLDETVTIISQVAAALDAVHARNLIHRDVKPSNILIEAHTGRAVLLDLGVARDLDSTTVTSSLMVGTPGFMAPEQVLEGGTISPQTDVYQLAATVYVMLAGQAPFLGDSLRVMDQVVHAAPADLSALRPDLPLAVVVTVAEAMAKNPDRRPHGALAFAELLQLSAAAPPADAPVPVSPTEPAAEAGIPPAPPPAGVARDIDSAVTIRVDPQSLAPASPRPEPAPVPASHRPASSATGARRALPLFLGGLGALAAVALGAGVIIARSDEEQPPAPTPSITASPPQTVAVTVTASPTSARTAAPTATPAPSAARSASPSPARTPSPSATRTATATRTPTASPAIEAAIRVRMLAREYRPDGEVVVVETSGRERLYVQKGICIGSATGRCQIAFIFIDTRFLGTDTLNASATILDIRAVDQDKFTITYAHFADNDPGCCPSLPPVTITYTWDGNKLNPSGTPPGHPRNATN